MTNFKESNNEKYVKQVADITDKEMLILAYEQKHGLYQHYSNCL